MTELPTTRHLSRPARQRALGALLGSAVADALGAPFEFGSAGAYRATFPEPVVGGTGEMTGGGSFGWSAGEFTDDTQMALALAESIITLRRIDPADLWTRWRAWATHASDVGVITRRALSHATHDDAAADAHRELGRSAGNGALMRVTPVGLAGAVLDDTGATTITMRAAVAQAALTHHEPAAGWGAGIAAELSRRAVPG
ncbi:MAG: ADP-ribosylglycohydrolase family protein, partial [Ilumatobacteraceae bacterium]